MKQQTSVRRAGIANAGSALFVPALVLIWLMNLTACNPPPKPDLVIVSQRILDSIPSGSGIAVGGQTAYIIGDDATRIFELDLNTYRHTSTAIPGRNPAIYREAKPVKHDFESAATVEWNGQSYLMALGSGSKVVTRDSLMLLNIVDKTDCRLFSLQTFYEHLRSETKTDLNRWNVEGATVADSRLILANRGTNSLMILELRTFLAWLQNPAMKLPQVEIQMLRLPAIQNKEARLSGLCTRNSNEILFCASVEDTPDWVADGPILGSFIGRYSLSRKAITAVYMLHDQQGNPLKEKLESLDMMKQHDAGNLDVLAIADNDDGTSTIFQLQVPSSDKD